MAKFCYYLDSRGPPMSYQSLAEALLSGKVYIGAAFREMQGVAARHRYFAPLVSFLAQASGKKLDVLEIGSWAGASTITWAVALRESDAVGSITCVDPWEAYFDVGSNSGRHYEEMNAAARGGLIARLFEHNLRAAGVEQMVTVRRGPSREILPGLPDYCFDL